jgi:urease accessory protein
MIRATRIVAAGEWRHDAADTVVLDSDARHRRRVAMSGIGGLEFLLDFANAMALRDGDGLLLEDGRIVAVKAAPEPLAEVRVSDNAQLLRLAWHIGNRHLPAEIRADRIRIRRDHVIEAMLAGLGATVIHVDAPFDPEGGAYAGHASAEPRHSHDHGVHGHDHD